MTIGFLTMLLFLREERWNELTLLANVKTLLRGDMAAVTAAARAGVLFFCARRFPQPASDSLGELLVAKPHSVIGVRMLPWFGARSRPAPAIRHPIGVESSPGDRKTGFRRSEVPPGFEVDLVRLQSPRSALWFGSRRTATSSLPI